MIGKTRRRLGAALALAVAAVLASAMLQGCDGGWGPALKSGADRLLPTPRYTAWARSPDPDSYSDWYRDASGSYANYVYDVEAATREGERVTVTIILFGRKASGEGWIEIDAKGTSGVHYESVGEDEVPQPARDVLDSGQPPGKEAMWPGSSR